MRISGQLVKDDKLFASTGLFMFGLFMLLEKANKLLLLGFFYA